MTDLFRDQSTLLDSPARDAFEITPSDSADLSKVTRGLWVGTEGDVAVKMYSGAEVTFVGVQGLLPVCVKRVLDTGTDAGDILGLV